MASQCCWEGEAVELFFSVSSGDLRGQLSRYLYSKNFPLIVGAMCLVRGPRLYHIQAMRAILLWLGVLVEEGQMPRALANFPWG